MENWPIYLKNLTLDHIYYKVVEGARKLQQIDLKVFELSNISHMCGQLGRPSLLAEVELNLAPPVLLHQVQ